MTETTVRLDGELSIYRAAELKPVLLEALAAGGALHLELSEVSELDSAGLQLLMLLKRTAQQRGQQLRLSGHSPAVLEVVELLDLGAYFGDPLVIGA
jgi:anti-anti-sigma factor